MELRFSDEVEDVEGLFILAYGEHGSGKTYMLRTAPRVVVADYDDGMLTNHDVRVPYLTKADLKTTQKLHQLLDAPPDLEDGKPAYGLAIDSGTAWIDELLFTEIKGDRGARVGLTQQDWGRVFVEIQSLFLHCKQAAKEGIYKYVIINFHTEAKEDKMTGELTLGPSIPGGMFWRAGRYADLYIRLQKHTTKHSVAKLRHSRDRINVVEDNEPPDIEAWLDSFAKLKERKK
jgi:hypothetical protein